MDKKKNLWIGAVLVALILCYAAFLALTPSVSDFDLPLKKMTIGQEVIKVEIADNDAVRQKGLMLRTFLHPNQGMLFIWDDESPRTMWMRDTFIPLDMIFMDAAGTIVAIVEQTEPHSLSPRGTERPSQYVLELAAGDAKRLGLAVGQKLTLP